MEARYWVACVLAGVGLTGMGVLQSRAADDFQVEPGYTLLFNGTNLTGWRQGSTRLEGATETANKKWRVTDGAIVIDGAGGGDIHTVTEYDKEFNLKLEFRAEEGADSGLYIRGPQLQVRDYPKAGPGQYARFAKPAGQWNELDVTVRNVVPSVRVNGQTVDAARVEADLKANPPQVKIDGKPVTGAVDLSVGPAATVKLNGQVIEQSMRPIPVRGPIGLQSERGKMEFRRIRIKEL
jgi:3-keto-disaccharide hydrolase